MQGETEFLNDIRATAEHTVGLMLSLLRRVPSAVVDVQKGGWDRDRFKGRELFGKTIGIVGYGRLGRIVGKYLKAFDTRLLVSDPRVDMESIDSAISVVGLEDLLQESDIVSLHVNLSDRTRNFFGKQQFSRMKSGAWFVNTARGELIDETALLDALRSGPPCRRSVGRFMRGTAGRHGESPISCLRARARQSSYNTAHWRLHRGVNGKNRNLHGQESNGLS